MTTRRKKSGRKATGRQSSGKAGKGSKARSARKAAKTRSTRKGSQSRKATAGRSPRAASAAQPRTSSKPARSPLVVIDNYDSFTWNLVQYLGSLGAEIEVFRNDAISVAALSRLRPRGIVISPGPGTPEDSGISRDVIKRFNGRVPVLGVCLGHQAIAEVFGAKIVRASTVMHGKTSRIIHDGHGIYRGLENPFVATRYHSLIVERESVPDSLEVTSSTSDAVIMGLRVKGTETWGVQFHPESILTQPGKDLLRNFLDLCGV